MKKFAILIPAYEPDHKLFNLIHQIKLNSYLKASPIILVDDGSGRSFDTLFNELDSTTHLIRYDENKGKGFALKTGFKYLLSNIKDVDAVVTIDSDGQHTVNDTVNCLKKYENNSSGTPLILGVRNFGRDIPARSKLGNIMTRYILSFSLGLKISDTQTGLRVIPSKYLENLLFLEGNRYEYEMQMLLFAKENKLQIIEVPIETIYINENESSHFNPVIDSIKIYSTFFKFIFSSMSSFFIDIFVFSLIIYAFKNLSIDKIYVASFLSRFISSLFNFLVNRSFVFREGNKVSLIKYFLLVIIQISFSASLISLGIALLPKVQITLMKVIVDLVLFLFSYQIQKKFIFVNKMES